jgi:molybdopterin-guanine dinucleotide biosynthesis protein A
MPSAAILAGGQARRFGGRDKSSLLVEGRSILDRQLEVLSTFTDDILLVMTDAGAIVTADEDSVNARPRVVRDRVAGRGPLGGLDAALAAARDPQLILVACDMPFVTAGLLGHLLSLANEADAVVPMTERGYHPLCAVYSRACLPAVQRALAERRLSMTALLEGIRTRVVPGHDIEAFGPRARLLTNVNTPAEFDELGALSGHKL